MSHRPTPPSPAPQASRRPAILAGAALVLAGLAVYANSLTGPFIFDDLLSIPQNPTIRRLLASLSPPGGGVTVTGRPVLNLSFAVDYALSGNHVWSYHALNLLIHLCAGLALFGIVRRTLLNAGRGRRTPPVGETAAFSDAALQSGAGSIAFAAALLWLVHPLQTESVTYVVQRAESLMGLFYLLTFYCFIRGVERQEPRDQKTRGPNDQATKGPTGEETRKLGGTSVPRPAGSPARSRLTSPLPQSLGSSVWFAASFLSCLLGMGTKEVMVSVPVMVFLYDRAFLAGSFRAAWHRRGRVHLALAATWLPLLVLVFHSADRGGTAGFDVGVGFWTYAVTQFQAVAHYLWLAAWPHPLVVDYGVKWVQSAADWVPYAVVVVPLAVGTLLALWRRPRLGFVGFWFFAILAPTSLVPGTRQTLAEHRMYLALAPVTVLVALGAYAWLGRRGRLLLGLVAAGFGWMTLQRNAVYHSNEAIWHDAVIKMPGNVAAHNNYGNILAEGGRAEEAMVQYREAIRLKPGGADAHYNAGKTLRQLGRYPEAIAQFEQALRANPKMPDAETELGLALESAGREDEALKHYEQALRLDPKYTNASNYLGLALAGQGKLTEAIAQYERALQVNPRLANVHNNLGNALRATGRIPEAIAQFEEALRLNPKFAPAHNNLGNAYRAEGRLPEAIAQYEQALKLDPAVPQVHNNLGVSLLMAERAPEAIAQFKEALRLDPNLGRVHLNLAIALESVGQHAEAAAEFQAAQRLGTVLPPPPPP